MITFVEVDSLWRGRSAWNNEPVPDSPWESGLTPRLLVDGSPVDIEQSIEDEEAAVRDLDTFDHWVEKLAPFAGRELEIPTSWALDATCDDDEWFIEDGFHRLAAAQAVGVRLMPVETPEEEK